MSRFYDWVTRGTRAAQAAAAAANKGMLYWVTDESKLERSSGSAWEAMSAAAAVTANGADVDTQETQSSNVAYGDLTTVGPSVTLTTGATVLIWISATITHGAVGNSAHVSVAVSGATTLAAADANSAAVSCYAAGHNLNAARVLLLTGLTPGSNTFTLKYRNDGGGTWNFHNRSIAVLAL